MQVKAELDDVTIKLGNKGITLRVSDNAGAHRGNLRVGQATIEWMQGRTREGNGIKMKLDDLLKLIESTTKD